VQDQQLVPESDVLCGGGHATKQEATEKEEDDAQDVHELDAPRIDMRHPTKGQSARPTLSPSILGRFREILH